MKKTILLFVCLLSAILCFVSCDNEPSFSTKKTLPKLAYSLYGIDETKAHAIMKANNFAINGSESSSSTTRLDFINQEGCEFSLTLDSKKNQVYSVIADIKFEKNISKLFLDWISCAENLGFSTMINDGWIDTNTKEDDSLIRFSDVHELKNLLKNLKDSDIRECYFVFYNKEGLSQEFGCQVNDLGSFWAWIFVE